MNPIEIRKAIGEDVAGICTVQDECRLSPWPRQAYEAEVGREEAIMLVAVTATGGPIGFITGRIIAGSDTSESHAEIYNLGVLPEFRARRVGSGLVQQFVNDCIDSGVQKVFLEVRQSNRQAIDFYLSHNFKKTGERRNFYSSPEEHAEIMTLKLGARVWD